MVRRGDGHALSRVDDAPPQEGSGNGRESSCDGDGLGSLRLEEELEL